MTQLATITNDQLSQARAAIAGADLQPSTQAKYERVLSAYLDTGRSLTDTAAVASHARKLSTSQRNFFRSALSLWAKHQETMVQSIATPENIDQVNATIHRLTALRKVIPAKKQKGEKTHTWLTRIEISHLLTLPGRDTLKGRRDAVALSLVVGAGLRREEAIAAEFQHIKRQPRRNGRSRLVLAITGKGAKDRAVPLSDNLGQLLGNWREEIGDGRILRGVTKGGELTDSLSAVGLFKIIRGYGEEMNLPELAPHDLRRTYAQVAFEAGIPITQISKLLGHANVATTQRYLNLDLDIETTASDFIPIIV